MTTRQAAKAARTAEILTAARRLLAERGAGAVNVREVATGVGVVPSALYRHFDSRDAILTALLIECYEALAAALAGAPLAWRGRADALRAWALAHPHEFHLLYGTPVPGYAAPADTIAPAAAVAGALLAPVRSGGNAAPPTLRDQLRPAAADLGIDEASLAWGMAALAQLVGLLLLELGGHFVGTADPADALWDYVVEGQSRECDPE